MSVQYDVVYETKGVPSRIIGGRIPVPQPENCKTHCPYGYGKAFCFPCMKKILGQDVEAPAKNEKGNA